MFLVFTGAAQGAGAGTRFDHLANARTARRHANIRRLNAVTGGIFLK